MNDNSFIKKIVEWIKYGGFLTWAIMIGLFSTGLWIPAAIMLLIKLEIIRPETWLVPTNRYSTDPAAKSQEQRENEYKNISRNLSGVSIEYFAGMVGVPFETAMRDVQKMILEGAFGPDAYIDYGTKRLIIRSGGTNNEPSYTPKNVTVNQSGSTVPQPSAPVQEQKPKPKPKPRARSSTKSKTSQKKKPSTQEIFKSQGALLWAGIIMLVTGGLIGIGAVDDFLSYGYLDFFEAMFPLVLAVTGGGMLGTRFLRKKRARRITSYLQIIGDRGSIAFSELASAVGESENTVKKDIEVMLDRKLLGDEAYMDIGQGKLIILRSAAREEPQTKEETESRYSEIVKEIRQLNAEIDDKTVSEKITQIEELTGKIFKVVEDKPEKLPEIKSFMSYYLPTTLKLLRSYRDFEHQGIGGDNIDATKERIEKILDTLVSGFSQQLDQLFMTDAMDISSDIDVLETMMKRDGLSKDDSGFGTPMAGV